MRANAAALGKWVLEERAEAHPARPGAVTLDAPNWEVWRTVSGTYDIISEAPSLETLVAPYFLIKMRLWEALAIWCTLVVVSVMLGGVLGVSVQMVSWLFFWRSASDLVRREWTAQGMQRCLVVAARSERDAHDTVGRLEPDLVWRYGRAVPIPAE
ncbi:MAG: hypothetical protein AAGF60_03825 [Pseudomonadota bacterium]